MNNNVFFQHPDLIRVLAVHETVMQLMVHTLSKASLDSPMSAAAAAAQMSTTTTTAASELQLHHEDGGRGGASSASAAARRRHGSGAGSLPAVVEEGEDATLSGMFLRHGAFSSFHLIIVPAPPTTYNFCKEVAHERIRHFPISDGTTNVSGSTPWETHYRSDSLRVVMGKIAQSPWHHAIQDMIACYLRLQTKPEFLATIWTY